MDIKSHLGPRLRKLRESLEISQDQVAQVLRVERSTYTNYELGKTEPGLEALCRLARMHKVTPDTLLGFDKPETMAPAPPALFLDKDETYLLCLFRTLSPDQQADALRVLTHISQQP